METEMITKHFRKGEKENQRFNFLVLHLKVCFQTDKSLNSYPLIFTQSGLLIPTPLYPGHPLLPPRPFAPMTSPLISHFLCYFPSQHNHAPSSRALTTELWVLPASSCTAPALLTSALTRQDLNKPSFCGEACSLSTAPQAPSVPSIILASHGLLPGFPLPPFFLTFLPAIVEHHFRKFVRSEPA